MIFINYYEVLATTMNNKNEGKAEEVTDGTWLSEDDWDEEDIDLDKMFPDSNESEAKEVCETKDDEYTQDSKQKMKELEAGQRFIEKEDPELLVIDLEWDFAPHPDADEKAKAMSWDLIEIGAVSAHPYSHESTVIHDMLIRPVIRDQVSQEFTDITGITNQLIEVEGWHLQNALRAFFYKAKKYEKWAFWGNRDMDVLRAAAKRAGIEMPQPKMIIDLKRTFLKSYKIRGSLSLLRVMCMLGKKGHGDAHRALSDALDAATVYKESFNRTEIQLVSDQKFQNWLQSNHPQIIERRKAKNNRETALNSLKVWEQKQPRHELHHLDLSHKENLGVWSDLFDSKAVEAFTKGSDEDYLEGNHSGTQETSKQEARVWLAKGPARLAKNVTLEALQGLSDLQANFGNFEEVIKTIRAQLICAYYAKKPIKIDPILLDGPPGTGKTEFSKELARMLSLPFYEFNIGSVHAKFEVAGGHPTWSSAQPGRITKYMLENDTMNPIILLDEIERSRAAEDVIQPLLQFIDRDQSKRAKDHFFDMGFDFSQIFFIATSNTLDFVDAALKSRFQVFDIKAPNKDQTTIIAKNLYTKVRNERSALYLAESLTDQVAAELAEMPPRQIRTALSHAINEATLRLECNGEVSEGDVSIEDLPGEQRSGKVSFGFIPQC